MTDLLPRSVIEPENPKLNVSRNANLPHSPGIRVGDYIFLSGMGPVDPVTGGRNLGPIAEQIRQTLRNMGHMLESAGSSLDRIVKITVVLADSRGLRRTEPGLARVLPGRPAGPHHLRLAAQQRQRRRDRVHRSRRARPVLSWLGAMSFGGAAVMDLKLAGKIVLITGSSRGIGLATAKAFAAEGCRIMLSARSAEQLRDAEAALRGTGAEAAAHVADVSDPADAARLIEATLSRLWRYRHSGQQCGGGGGGARIADSTDEDWRGALERNLIQTVRMMRLALPHMRGRPGAAVINIASISGWSPQLAMSGQYGAAKAALIFDTERWALEFVPYGIRVNTISPGSILVEGNGWDRYRLANPSISTITSGTAFRWAGSDAAAARFVILPIARPAAPLGEARSL